MAFNSGTIYCIPEHPEEYVEKNCSAVSLSVKKSSISKVEKKVSSTSLPDHTSNVLKCNLNSGSTSMSLLTASGIKIQVCEALGATSSPHTGINNRLSVSLIDFSDFRITSDSGLLRGDKTNPFVNIASSCVNPMMNSKSYLEVHDCISHSNHEPGYETLLSSSAISKSNVNHESNSAKISYAVEGKERKKSDNLSIIDLKVDLERRLSTNDLSELVGLRQRSPSLQWIQNTFQNVSNKYRNLLEFRRPSDIAEERMRKSKELEMDEPEYEELSTKQIPAPGGRRFSENIIGKQKKFPFSSRINQLKGLWRDKNSGNKRQEEKDSDQNRHDVCPLFHFPCKSGDEDELILDALRQAMRKCTVVDPSSRPTSTTVLDQLSKLFD